MSSGKTTGAQSQFLAAVPYFKGLDQSTLESVVRSSIWRDVDAGQLVILEGEPNAGLYAVEIGWLKVVKIAVDGREQVLQFLGPGDTFNAISVFTGAPNPATVVALEDARIWFVRREEMLRLLRTQPSLAQMIIQELAGRIQHLISLVEDLSLRTVEARLARLLLEQAEDDRVTRQKWATQSEIAARLGTVPDVISRVLRKLADEGLLRIDRQWIQILNRQELEERAQLP